MSFHVDTPSVRQVWNQHAAQAPEILGSALRELPAARGVNMGRLTAVMSEAADIVRGVSTTACALVEEHDTLLVEALSAYDATDDDTRVGFVGLTPRKTS